MFIHRIAVHETNCYLVQGAEGTMMIDAGPRGAAKKIVAGTEAAGVSPQNIRLIFITHGHLDHYGAAGEIKAWCGAPVATYHSEPFFSQEKRNALPPAQTLRGSIVRWLYLLLGPLFPFAPLEPDILLDDSADLSPYGVDARTIVVQYHDTRLLIA